MSDTKSTEPATSGGGPIRLVLVAVLCLALAGGGYVLGGRMAGGATVSAAGEEGAEGEHAEEAEEVHIVEVVDLDPVNVNLAEGHYLRIAVSLGLSEPASDGHGGGFTSAPAADLVLGTFSGRLVDELATQAGRDAARQDLTAGLIGYYGEQVVTVYFREFVMQ